MAATASPLRLPEREIAFPRRHVHPGHDHSDLISQAEAAAAATSSHPDSRGVQHEMVVEVLCDPDEALHRVVVQLDEEPARNQPGDDTRSLLPESPLENPKPFDLDGLALGVGRVLLGGAASPCELLEGEGVR